MTNGVRNKLTPLYLKFFAARTITECEYQAIKLADHTQKEREFATIGLKLVPLVPESNCFR